MPSAIDELERTRLSLGSALLLVAHHYNHGDKDFENAQNVQT